MRTDGTHVYPAMTRRGVGTRVVGLFHWEAGNRAPTPPPLVFPLSFTVKLVMAKSLQSSSCDEESTYSAGRSHLLSIIDFGDFCSPLAIGVLSAECPQPSAQTCS